MAKIPRSQQVSKALRSLRRELKSSVKETNRRAAKRLGKGDYAGAQRLIEIAQSIAAFDQEVAGMNSRWRGLRSGGKMEEYSKDTATPLWEYYQPVLQALVALGGSATRREIEERLATSLPTGLTDGDLANNAKGIPRWKQMVGRSRKHMIREGFLANEKGFRWKITAKGEQAAKQSS